MAWTPTGAHLFSNLPEGMTLINILNSLARELARLQAEIDELKRSK
jgi:hypothetical protein